MPTRWFDVTVGPSDIVKANRLLFFKHKIMLFYDFNGDSAD